MINKINKERRRSKNATPFEILYHGIRASFYPKEGYSISFYKKK
jgi:hypothetical protein